MAKKKMTLEEKLEEAIVKDIPYELPGNWVWTKIGKIASIHLGLTYTPKYVENGVPFLSVKDISQGSINFENTRFISQEEYENAAIGSKPKKGDILFGRVGTLGCPQIVTEDKEFCIFVSLGFFRVLSENIIRKFIVYWMESYLFDMQVKLNVKGSTLKNLNTGWLKEFHLPIPPLKEQQRIVDKIESLFEKLDKAKELIEEAREDFEKRKQSIIEKALMGEYVSGVKLTEIELGNILSFKNGMSKRAGKEGNETRVLRLADISGDVISSEYARSMLLTDKEIANYKVEDGELLIIRVNGTKKNVGKAIEYKGENICAYCDHLIRIDCAQVNKSYIKYLINSHSVRKQIDDLIVSSAGQNTISQSSLNKIKAMWIEDNKIQEAIVNVINMLINKEKNIQELTALEDKIELIKKSILAKAFRGQLGTNCEEDESALELLKEILNT